MKFDFIQKFLRFLFSERNKDFDSKNYWEERYSKNGNSGSGSYARLAEFKAEIINDFVIKNKINNVLELGCGDGNQLSLSNYPNYIGVDVSEKAVNICREKFKDDNSKKFLNYHDFKYQSFTAELVLSLDVIYHLIEDSIYDGYMTDLFRSSSKYVVIYSSNHTERIANHVRCRKFSNWIQKNLNNTFKLIYYKKNIFPFHPEDPDNTSHSDFYFYERVL